METLQHVFPLHQAHPPSEAPALAQGPPSPPAPGAPVMPENPGEVHVVVDCPDTPKIVVINSGDGDHQDEEDDPEKDQDIDEGG